MDVEELKKSLGNIKKVLSEADNIRSWLYTKGDNSAKGLSTYSDDIRPIEKLEQELENHDWNLSSFFTELAERDCGEGEDFEILPNYEEKVEEHVNRIIEFNNN